MILARNLPKNVQNNRDSAPLRSFDPLRPIYTVQLCRMRYTYDKFTTRVVSRKSNLQLAYDCRVRHEECRGLLKHVLKPYDNRSDRQFDIVEIVYDFSMTRAARATKIACDNRKQKLYRVNRPLLQLFAIRAGLFKAGLS